MTREQLEIGNNISERIDIYDRNIKLAMYTQNEDVATRVTHLKVHGLDEAIEVPATLFRVIGKLILSEYREEKEKLKQQLSEL